MNLAKEWIEYFWVITQRIEVISHRRFRSFYRSYPQGSRIVKMESDIAEISAQMLPSMLFSIINPLKAKVTYHYV
jgi:hypothetical protein